MDRLQSMEAFVRVAEVRSFAEAARRWGRSKAVVSKYVGHLEAHLGVQLFQRTTRSVVLTDAGRAHFDSCQQILALVEESETQLKDDHVSLTGSLRVTAPPGLVSEERRVLVASFLRRYPRVSLDLDVTYRMVDLVEERVDVAIRVTQPRDSSLVARKLAPAEMVLVASPAYLSSSPPIHGPEDLRQHACLVDRNFGFQPRWPFVIGGRRQSVEVAGPVRANDPFVVRDLALEGMGVALIARVLARRELAEGRLTEVLPGTVDLQTGIYAITSQRRRLPARVRAFLEHLRRELPPLVGPLAPTERESNGGPGKRDEG
ncbi:MAG: LysR family transcriptional regulator [Myxococcota bacterium]